MNIEILKTLPNGDTIIHLSADIPDNPERSHRTITLTGNSDAERFGKLANYLINYATQLNHPGWLPCGDELPEYVRYDVKVI